MAKKPRGGKGRQPRKRARPRARRRARAAPPKRVILEAGALSDAQLLKAKSFGAGGMPAGPAPDPLEFFAILAREPSLLDRYAQSLPRARSRRQLITLAAELGKAAAARGGPDRRDEVRIFQELFVLAVRCAFPAWMGAHLLLASDESPYALAVALPHLGRDAIRPPSRHSPLIAVEPSLRRSLKREREEIRRRIRRAWDTPAFAAVQKAVERTIHGERRGRRAGRPPTSPFLVQLEHLFCVYRVSCARWRFVAGASLEDAERSSEVPAGTLLRWQGHGRDLRQYLAQGRRRKPSEGELARDLVSEKYPHLGRNAQHAGRNESLVNVLALPPLMSEADARRARQRQRTPLAQ